MERLGVEDLRLVVAESFLTSVMTTICEDKIELELALSDFSPYNGELQKLESAVSLIWDCVNPHVSRSSFPFAGRY